MFTYSIGSDLISKSHPAKLEDRTGILTLYVILVTVFTICLTIKASAFFTQDCICVSRGSKSKLQLCIPTTLTALV